MDLTIPLVVITGLGLVGIATWLASRWMGRRGGTDEDPILLFDANGSGRKPRAGKGAPAAAGTRTAGGPSGVRTARPLREARPSEEEAAPAESAPPSDAPPSEWVEAGPVRFERPAEGTLQLLPGRLVIESDAGRGEEVRFVRVPGTPAQVTFGRSGGPAHRHVQLQSPTVSRLHAEMNFADGGWTIVNHSTTNPTMVNGRSLEPNPTGVELQDGDRIEMGEVLFRFHQPGGQDRLATRSSWHTDRALRSMNQDAVLVRTLSGRRELAAVCDGMGSHGAGGMASRLALDSLAEALDRGQSLRAGVEQANRAIRQAVQSDPTLEGMGTTLVAVLREGDAYELANVGDSRAYRVDAAGIHRLTRDHSFVAEAVASGEMSAEEAERSPWRHAITRNLGGNEEVEVDLFPGGSAQEPHVVVLCSDGVHGALDDAAIDRIVRNSADLRDTARILCEDAIRMGSRDNVTAAVVAFGGGVRGVGEAG
jgi:PPM family protein phosphatase